jgi:FkbM family methyltransferase
MVQVLNMLKKISIACGIVLILLAVFWLGLAISPKLQVATVRAYFKLEHSLIERSATQSGKIRIMELRPVMAKIGLLHPVRMKVDAGISFLLDPRDFVSATILSEKQWQPEVWDSLSPVLRAGSVLLDVGAHIGYFSLKGALKVGPSGRVISFEPNPETLVLLRDNVAVNRASNITVEPIACSDRDQMLTLFAAPIANTGASSLSRDNADLDPDTAPAKAYPVRARPIDDVVRELDLRRVDAIKIDVEGAEVSVLRGAIETLKRFHPKVVIEIVERQLASFHTTPADVTAILKEAGYNQSKAIDSDDWEWIHVGADTALSTVDVADGVASGQLIRGFHSLEANAWRWTDQNFTVALPTPAGANRSGAALTLILTVPDVSLQKLKTLTLSAKAGGVSLPPETYTTPGRYEYKRQVPGAAFNKDMMEVDFSLDKALPTGGDDPQRLGVIVTAVSLKAK